MKRKPVRAYHHPDLHSELLRAALQILERVGWHQLSLREIARVAGVSAAAPYRHFASKEALLASLCAEGFAELARAMKAAIDEAPNNVLGQLTGTATAYVGLATTRPALFRLMFGGGVRSQDPDFIRVCSEGFELLQEIFVSGQARGEIRAGDTFAMAIVAWSAVHGFSHLVLDAESLMLPLPSLDAGITNIANTIFSGVARGPDAA